MINIQKEILRRVNKYLKEKNIESKVASLSELYAHHDINLNLEVSLNLNLSILPISESKIDETLPLNCKDFHVSLSY